MKFNAHFPFLLLAVSTAAERLPLNLAKHLRPRQYSAPPPYSPVYPTASSSGDSASPIVPSASQTSIPNNASSTDLPSAQTSSLAPNATDSGPSTILITTVVVITSVIPPPTDVLTSTDATASSWGSGGPSSISVPLSTGPQSYGTGYQTSLPLYSSHGTSAPYGNNTGTISSPWGTGTAPVSSSLPPTSTARSSTRSRLTTRITISVPHPSSGTLTETSTGPVATSSGNVTTPAMPTSSAPYKPPVNTTISPSVVTDSLFPSTTGVSTNTQDTFTSETPSAMPTGPSTSQYVESSVPPSGTLSQRTTRRRSSTRTWSRTLTMSFPTRSSASSTPATPSASGVSSYMSSSSPSSGVPNSSHYSLISPNIPTPTPTTNTNTNTDATASSWITGSSSSSSSSSQVPTPSLPTSPTITTSSTPTTSTFTDATASSFPIDSASSSSPSPTRTTLETSTSTTTQSKTSVYAPLPPADTQDAQSAAAAARKTNEKKNKRGVPMNLWFL